MDVSVIITCWNGKDLLSKNLPLVVEAARNKENRISEIIIVDDGSTDDSVEYLKKLIAGSEQLTAKNNKLITGSRSPVTINLVENGKNYGYAFSCNRGVKEAKAELVAILNLDVIPEKDFLVSCLPHFKDNKVFSVSFNEGNFGPGKLAWENGFLEIQPTQIPKTTTETDWPSGGSSIFRKIFWNKLGGMDELFLPFYYEDIDLGIRAGKEGYKCLWEPQAKVEHKHEGTINSDSFKQKYIDLIKQRNQLLLIWKNINRPELFFSHSFHLFLRCFFHPGYIQVLLLAFRRKFFNLRK